MQNFEGNREEGVVHTDYKLIDQMLSIFPESVFKNPKLKWLDPCCGHGYFMISLLKRLIVSLKGIVPDPPKEYIIKPCASLL